MGCGKKRGKCEIVFKEKRRTNGLWRWSLIAQNPLRLISMDSKL